jgi:hypothetical protein
MVCGGLRCLELAQNCDQWRALVFTLEPLGSAATVVVMSNDPGKDQVLGALRIQVEVIWIVTPCSVVVGIKG